MLYSWIMTVGRPAIATVFSVSAYF